MKVEIKPYFWEDEKKTVNALFFDDKPFDWGVPKEALEEVALLEDSVIKTRYYLSLKNHFIQNLSIFLERKITLKELNEAIKVGEL